MPLLLLLCLGKHCSAITFLDNPLTVVYNGKKPITEAV